MHWTPDWHCPCPPAWWIVELNPPSLRWPGGARRIFWGLCRILDGVRKILDGVRRIVDGVHRILERQAGRQRGSRQAGRQEESQRGRQAGRQADRQRGRQAGRMAGRQARREGGREGGRDWAARTVKQRCSMVATLNTQRHWRAPVCIRERKYVRACTHTGALALAGVRSSTASTMLDECYRWWMSATVWLQQSECMDECYAASLWFQQSECFCMRPVVVCHVHTAWSRENVELSMSFWRTWKVYERFTFFVNAKEHRSKTNVTRIKKN